ncbi:hypothetical protein [Coleofasciculus sp. FACHB-542]|uniref:hypothetical protein n=1 Tax=Coleofasciculus sp. FACHB-542 TaxID=2692787 RepID=UPI0016865941|nr:hypothetical protein [Coleofasciculus sp. FACHB-542]MBD2084048.1 hypothetical protein [Coleofasciculus sp. FACHB-542]
MSYLSFIRNLPEKLTQPPLIAALASVGIHGVLAMTLPSLSASSKPEEQKPRGTVKVVELTPAEQSRIPQLAPPPVSLPPSPNQTQLLPPLPPPSSVLPPIPSSPPYKFPLNSTPQPNTGAGLPEIFQRSSDRRQQRARQNPFNPNNPNFIVGRLPDPPKVPQSGSRKVTQQEIRRRLFQGLPAGVQPGQDDISALFPPPPPTSDQQTPFNPSEESSGKQPPIDFGQQTPSNPKPQRSIDFGQQTPNSEPQIAANSEQQTSKNSEQQPPATSGQQTPPLSPQQIAMARRELQRQQVLADIRQQRRNYAYDGNGTRDDDYRQKLAGWGSRLNKVPSKEQEITLTSQFRACFIKKPEATALVGAQVDAKGSVTTELLRSSGYNILNEKAQEVVKAHSFGAKEQVYVVQVKFAYNEKDCPPMTASREARNSQEVQDSRKPRDSQESSEPQKPRDSQNSQNSPAPRKLRDSQEAQDSRRPRDSQESSESQKPRDSQNSQNSPEPRKPRDSQESSESQKPRDSQNSQNSPEPRKPRDSQEAQDSRKPRDSQESSESQKPRDSQNSQNSPEPRKPRDSQEAQDSRKPRDSQESSESQKPRESQESSESKKPQDSQNSQNSPEPRKPQESPDSQNSQQTP